MPQGRGIGLRGRLAAFFVVITVFPVLGAVLALQVQIDERLTARAESELLSVRQAALALVDAARVRAGDLATDVAALLAAEPLTGSLDEDEAVGVVSALVAERILPQLEARADAVVVLGPGGDVVTAEVLPADFVGTTAPDAEALAAAVGGGPPVVGALLEVRELVLADDPTPVGWVLTAVWTDAELLGRVGLTGRAALVVDGAVVAVTQGTTPEDVPAARDGRADVTRVEGDAAEGDAVDLLVTTVRVDAPGTAAVDAAAPVELVLWTPQEAQPSPFAVALPMVVPAVVVAALLGMVLASAVVAPVRRAAEVARAVAAGDLRHHLEPGGGRELTELAVSLNRMTAVLAARLAELEEREQQLRASLARLGQTLSSSLDLNRMLSVVVDTARDTLRADRALLALFTPERDALYTKVGRGLDGHGLRVRLGEGLVGSVAERGTPILIPGKGPAPTPAPGEPTGASQLVVPMLVRGRVLGVLSLLRDGESEPFTEVDLETVRSFATQASVAVENVMLHQEAQRLSVTDPLTGLWNFRYFQLQADREVEAASRSGRPLSLIVADIDHFKAVNDRFGHQVGDEVLIEVARRLRDSTRVPDVVARYGGEEFIVLLPDTDLEGAAATAERIRAAVVAEPIRPVGAGVTATTGAQAVEPLVVSCSVGVATLPDHGSTVATLLRAADAAMYDAKQQGRDRVVLAGG